MHPVRRSHTPRHGREGGDGAKVERLLLRRGQPRLHDARKRPPGFDRRALHPHRHRCHRAAQWRRVRVVSRPARAGGTAPRKAACMWCTGSAPHAVRCAALLVLVRWRRLRLLIMLLRMRVVLLNRCARSWRVERGAGGRRVRASGSRVRPLLLAVLRERGEVPLRRIADHVLDALLNVCKPRQHHVTVHIVLKRVESTHHRVERAQLLCYRVDPRRGLLLRVLQIDKRVR